MARTKATELGKPRSKTSAAVEELNRGIEKLQSLKAAVEDLRGEGFPYRDAVRARTELQIRDAIKRLFGDRSPEYQENKGHRLRTGSQAEISETIHVLDKLIGNLEHRKLDLLGLRPSPSPEPPTTSPSPQTPVLTLVPPVATAPATATPPPGAPCTPPVPPAAPAAQIHHQAPPGPPVAVAPVVHPPAAEPSPPRSASPPAPAVVTQATPVLRQPPAGAPSQPSPASAGTVPKTVEASAPPPAEIVTATVEPTKASPGPRSGEDDTLATLRKVCSRFHIVARQLRLRKEYRATLEVEDDYDAQDLFFALLRLQFDEVGSEDWVPRYSDGATRTAFLLNKGSLVAVVKKTRPGLTTREIQDQLRIDMERFSSQRGHAVLFCFVYDPEGRIGNPTGFEAEVTSVGSRYRVELVVAPK